MLLRRELSDNVSRAIQAAQAAGDLPAFDVPSGSNHIERPQQRKKGASSAASTLGDYATPVALSLARPAKLAPLQIAEQLVQHLPPHPAIGQVTVAPPGYVNFTLDNTWLARQVEAILAAGETWGNIALGLGQKVQVEHGSINPTGPLHVAHGRNVVIGDTLANVLAAAGYEVQREYYINDAGSQVRTFGASVYARYAQALGQYVPFPEQGYQGVYVIEMGHAIAHEHGSKFLDMPREEGLAAITQLALDGVLADIRDTLAQLRIYYDNWFSERSLYESGLWQQVLAMLQEKGLVVEREGAVWFAAQELGEDKDAVLIRSPHVIADERDRPTYLASDVAYVWNKLVVRGFDRAIYVWGADHHGDIARVKAAARALGLDPNRVIVILYQMVLLKRGDQMVRMSKRTGDIITLREVVEEVGPDAVRFLLLMRAADSQMDFDLELAMRQSAENPVFYVQYGHARIASILRKSEASQSLGFSGEDGDVTLLKDPAELTLIRKMLELPELIELASNNLEPHHLPHYAQTLATVFHDFYERCQVLPTDRVPVDPALTAARLKLVRAAQIVLARTLHLMGMSAPESM
jgi:arginyl-tRNA synthetase